MARLKTLPDLPTVSGAKQSGKAEADSGCQVSQFVSQENAFHNSRTVLKSVFIFSRVHHQTLDKEFYQ